MMNRTKQTQPKLVAVLMGLAIPGMTQQAQTPPRHVVKTPLERSAEATELPVGAWGPHSRLHSGPCFLAERARAQMFAFPIVVGQRRVETILRTVTLANGKTRLRGEQMALERRVMDLAPMQAWDDDRQASDMGGAANRQARIREADANGIYWSANAFFAPAQVAQNVLTSSDANGKVSPPAPWGAGEATIAYFPANIDPTGDGLLVRVTLTNHSAAPQIYFVDLLGGMDAPAPLFSPADLIVERDANTDNMVIRHKMSPAVFALAGNAKDYPQRGYRVSGAYFAPEGAVCSRSMTGAALPCGLLTDDESAKPEQANLPAGKPMARSGAAWGLLRVDDITIQPEESVTIVLCVGMGRDGEGASEAAQALLSQCEDTLQNGSRRKGEGLATKALAAHKAARFNSGSEIFDRLMAQSLVNAPNYDFRRVGVPSRHETQTVPGGIYQPENGGWTALAWSLYRPDWSAAQLNAYFLTEGDAATPIANPQAVPPTNLFALWELYQKTRDRAMLARFYPLARRRYRELLAAGRVGTETNGLYAWPAPRPRHELTLAGMPANGPAPSAMPGESASRAYAPDFSAYVIRAAKLLRRMAEETKQPPEEIQKYSQDAGEATSALNENLWDSNRAIYVAKPVMPMLSPPNAESVNGLLPLIAGRDALSPMQRAELIRHLSDPVTFWGDAGLRSLSKSSPAYRPGSPQEGAIAFGKNYLLWKALLDAGEAQTAQKLAENLLRAYAAQAPAYGFPEGLDGETGAAFGAADYTGDACALLALQAAYHMPGTVATGWDTDLLSSHYDRAADALRVGWRSFDAAASGVLLCMMGKPNGKYHLSGAMTGPVTADANGLLTITAPRDATTQSLEITPL